MKSAIEVMYVIHIHDYNNLETFYQRILCDCNASIRNSLMRKESIRGIEFLMKLIYPEKVIQDYWRNKNSKGRLELLERMEKDYYSKIMAQGL